MRHVHRAVKQNKHSLLRLKNVVGVGVGYKERHSVPTEEKALMVCVTRKIAEGNLPHEHVIPKHVGKVATDVVEVGEFKSYQEMPNRRASVRPARPGVSIGHESITCGTFGALVRDNKTRQVLILSNNHILANLTNGNDGRSQIGDPILQPGPGDGGTVSEALIGTLFRYVPIFYDNTTVNKVDAAVALPTDRRLVDGKILGLTVRPRGTEDGVVAMRVYKSGAASGVTSGRIRIVDLTVRIGYGFGETAIFENQILTNKMAGPGDSGSLLVNGGKKAVGLLVGGSYNAVIYNPIKNVLRLLDVSI
ncbi:S1 family peptidase [Metallumcola ferriviriculae]|uniref:S1 family peptidase n=1 Tax=Metallumcola ferriviriculae TaxID=3039180 RepID=A0AAU0UK06_9FIRM|nr:S1 family peptidase [Desulfitibacteraceae bacterium MK1]